MNYDNPNLPNMSEVVESWSSDIYFYKIKKEQGDDYILRETKTLIKARGMIQNARDTDLDIQDRGQRQWKYYKLHTTTNILNIDDIVEIQNVKYRVKSKSQDYLHYGFYRYILIEDYLNSTEINKGDGNE